MWIAFIALLKLNRTFCCRNHQKAGKSLTSGDLCLHSRRRKGFSKQLRRIRYDRETHTILSRFSSWGLKQAVFFFFCKCVFNALYQWFFGLALVLIFLWFGPPNAIGLLYNLTFICPLTLTATLIYLKFAFWVEARAERIKHYSWSFFVMRIIWCGKRTIERIFFGFVSASCLVDWRISLMFLVTTIFFPFSSLFVWFVLGALFGILGMLCHVFKNRPRHSADPNA